MEQEGGAEVELGASGGRRLEEEVEAATPDCCCCCCCEEGDADIDDVVVAEVDASVLLLSIPPLLAPRRCVAVVAVPIRHDAEPPSEKERRVKVG